MEFLQADPKAELQILPESNGSVRLTYRVQLQSVTDKGEPSMPNLFIDAKTGEVVKQFDNLKTSRNRNTYNANNPIFRFPLDHVFHSNHFKLFRLRRLDKVGSDHFPVLIELNLEPGAEAEQPASQATASDEETAQEIVERAPSSGAAAR